MQTKKCLLPRLSGLAIALSAALAPLAANADQTVSTFTTVPLSTASGVTENVTITATGAIITSSDLSVVAISNAGTITTLTNAGAILSGFAINNTGTIGTIINTGTLIGNIVSTSATNLTINGGTGSVFGLLGPSSSIPGVILNRNSNVVFASGNTTLNDNIDVGSRTVNVTGATLQINNTIAIVGSYNQSAGAILQIGVGADGSSGSIIVANGATIAASSTVTLTTLGYGFAAGQRYVIVRAAPAGTNFNAGALQTSAVNFSGTVTGQTVIDGGFAYLVLTLANTSPNPDPIPIPVELAKIQSASASLAGLLNYNGVNARLLNLFDAAEALNSTAAANHAGEQLSPSANTVAAMQSAAASTVEVEDVVGAHIDGLRLAQAQGSSGISAGDGTAYRGVWGQAFGGQANQGLRDGIAGYHAGYNGLLLGADTLVSENWRLGGLLSYANTSVANIDDNTGSSAHVVSYGLMGYAGYTAERWYMDFSAGAVQHQFDTVRSINFTGFSGSANGHFNGTQYVASARAGYPIKLMPDTTLTPIAGLNYSGLTQDAYTESGGNGAALNVRSSKSTSVRSELAAKLERVFACSYGDIVPSAQLGWRHEFHKDAQQSVASFAADGSNSTGFTSLGPTPLKNTAVLALGVTLMRSSNLSLSAKYTVEAGSAYIAQTADLRLRYQF
ncbi:MAG: outer rane autotransporter [Herbaspirillum sp.]|nr:outer rane autotransporter [Herbaspirillum sp.]